MKTILSDLKREPWFWLGLAIKLAILYFATPITQIKWFYPFIANAIDHFSLNLWQSYLNTAPAGAPAYPFPYGIVMATAFLPLTVLGKIADITLHSGIFFGIGFKLTLLLFDTLAFVFLVRLWPTLCKKLIWFFWLSPLVIYITYWHGQLDIVPVAILLGVFLLLKQTQAARAGGALAVAVAAKLSMLVALPLMLIYFWRNKRLNYLSLRFILAFILGCSLLVAPFLLMHGFRAMVLDNPEMQRLYELKFTLGTTTAIYLAPLFYILALYALWRMPRISFDLLFAATGLVFFVLIISTAAPLGWYIWLMPFLAWYQSRTRLDLRLLVEAFVLLIIAGHVVLSTGAMTPLGLVDGPDLLDRSNLNVPPHLYALWQTSITALGCILMWQMQRETIRRNDYFRLSRRPLAIAITGDSGSGKDRFAHTMIDLFGAHSVSHLSGDNYHLWDREGPLWKNLTHLNPRANDLQHFMEDAHALMDKRTIMVTHYDHKLGRYFPPHAQKSNDVVIMSGLHALYDERLWPNLAVRIYLDTDDNLRRHWKTLRDVKERGHEPAKVNETNERRQKDSVAYIQPQKQNADLIFALKPVHPERLGVQSGDPHCKLHIIARHSLYHERLALLLVGLCGLHVQMTPSPDLREVEWNIEGDVSAEDVAFTAQKLLPHFAELLDNRPHWHSGMPGIMQLFALAHIDSNLRNQS